VVKDIDSFVKQTAVHIIIGCLSWLITIHHRYLNVDVQ